MSSALAASTVAPNFAPWAVMNASVPTSAIVRTKRLALIEKKRV